MIIVSQDKTKMINFDNVSKLYIKSWDTYKCFAIVAEKNSDKLTDNLLGKYGTEERTKGVLKEIWKFYEISKRSECSSNNGITIFLEPKFVYQMPER